MTLSNEIKLLASGHFLAKIDRPAFNISLLDGALNA